MPHEVGTQWEAGADCVVYRSEHEGDTEHASCSQHNAAFLPVRDRVVDPEPQDKDPRRRIGQGPVDQLGELPAQHGRATIRHDHRQRTDAGHLDDLAEVDPRVEQLEEKDREDIRPSGPLLCKRMPQEAADAYGAHQRDQQAYPRVVNTTSVRTIPDVCCSNQETGIGPGIDRLCPERTAYPLAVDVGLLKHGLLLSHRGDTDSHQA